MPNPVPAWGCAVPSSRFAPSGTNPPITGNLATYRRAPVSASTSLSFLASGTAPSALIWERSSNRIRSLPSSKSPIATPSTRRLQDSAAVRGPTWNGKPRPYRLAAPAGTLGGTVSLAGHLVTSTIPVAGVSCDVLTCVPGHPSALAAASGGIAGLPARMMPLRAHNTKMPKSRFVNQRTVVPPPEYPSNGCAPAGRRMNKAPHSSGESAT